MAESRDDGSIAPRRRLSGPILPPPPPELIEDTRKAEEAAAAARRTESEKAAAEKAASKKAASAKAASEKQAARESARSQKAQLKKAESQMFAPQAVEPGTVEPGQSQRSARPARRPRVSSNAPRQSKQGPPGQGTPRRTRRAQLRLVQVDAWSVMKTSFLLSIALGIVLVIAVSIIWSVLGAAGVWESINSIVQQAVGGDNNEPFDIQEYVGTSRVLGFTMIVAVLDVILITAIATLGAFLYNLSAALLGGIEVTLAEDN